MGKHTGVNATSNMLSSKTGQLFSGHKLVSILCGLNSKPVSLLKGLKYKIVFLILCGLKYQIGFLILCGLKYQIGFLILCGLNIKLVF